jgi:MYXO-CTERM domain-containing protein
MLYGGYNTQAGTYINSAEIYNSSNNTWTSNTPSIPNNVYESELHSTWAVHGGSGKIMTISSYYPTLYDPTTAVWTQAGQSDGVNYFYSMGSQGGIASVGNKVLLFPVSPNGSYSPSAICKLFDYVQQGGICSADTDCKTGLKCVYDNQAYVDGQSVCCDATCTDECSSCRAANKESKTGEGACGPRDHTQSVAYNKCPYESPSTCGNVGYKCDGKGACAKWDSSTTCLSQGCADTSTQNNDAKCDGKGTCGTQTTTACTTGYNCVYSQCYTQCGDDYFCANNYYCQYWASPAATVNQCLQRKANGKACTNNSTTECASGNCVDGFCCDTACNGGCEACSNALTGKTNGVCSAIPAGQASNKDCNDQFPASCGQTGFCNGARACQKYASGTPCADLAACAGEGTRYVPDQCDGSGTCTDKGTQPCNTGYSCQGGVCNTSCTSDANCISAYFCDTVTSTCVADHKQGQTCKSAQGCEGNANCVDGVCCDSACTGTCRSCVKNRTGLAADGVCGNTLDDTDPEAECPIDVGYPASCKAPGTCADNGTCRVYAKPGVQAKADACSSGTLTVTTCDGAGNPTHVDTACYPYKCNAANTACRVACTKATEDTDCDDSSFCQDGKCIGVLPQGTACTEGTQCKSGFCADQHLGALEGDPAPDPGAGGDSSVDPVDHPGVCCDSACGNGCEACKKSLKAQGADGTCGKVADHTDAKGDCKSAADKPCGHNNECDGSGNCRNVPSGASCGSSSCVGNSARGQICDGNGGCVNDSAILCTPYVCRDVNGAQQCTNPCAEDNDCDDGYYCVETACKKKLAPGKTCDSSGICASGFCVDGVCCDVSCKGQCEACDVPGSEGVCSPVQGDPHGDRPVCDHSGEECGGACDGVNSAACKYAAVGTSCGTTTCDNDLASSSECNGQGECKANKNTECSPYTCGTDDTCLSRCEQDADCSQGYGCDETTQRCLPAAVSTTCSEDRLTSVGQNGQSTPCKPFLCVPASGSCAVSCAFTTDCAPDFVCEPSTKTCLPAPAGTGDDTSGSCACRAAGATQSRSGYWALAAFGVALSSLRRRRRSKRPALNLAKSPLAQDSHPFE